jgi:competence protein ComEA
MLRERLEDRLQGLDRRELAGLAVIAILVVAGAAFWYVRSLPSRVEITSTGARATTQASPEPEPTPTPVLLLVHVAGWVHHPGVFELHEGQRVIDAIEAAGGAKAGADLTTINLAALLTDAQQIVVAKRGATGPGPPSSGTSVGSGEASELVNINTATLDQLETLPGIGEVLAQRIVDYREEHGPFGSAEDLLDVSGIGDATLADLKPHITV